MCVCVCVCVFLFPPEKQEKLEMMEKNMDVVILGRLAAVALRRLAVVVLGRLAVVAMCRCWSCCWCCCRWLLAASQHTPVRFAPPFGRAGAPGVRQLLCVVKIVLVTAAAAPGTATTRDGEIVGGLLHCEVHPVFGSFIPAAPP